MVQYGELAEEFFFFIDLGEEAGVFLSEDEDFTGIQAEADVFFEGFYHEGLYVMEEGGVIVVVGVQEASVRRLPDNGQGEGGVDVKVVVKGQGAAIGADHVVHENGGDLVGAGGGHPDAAFAFQAFGVGKGHAGYAGTVAAGVDADHEFPGAVVGVVLTIEFFHDHQGFGVSEVGVEDGEVFGEFPGILKLLIEFYYFVGEGFHGVILFFEKKYQKNIHKTMIPLKNLIEPFWQLIFALANQIFQTDCFVR